MVLVVNVLHAGTFLFDRSVVVDRQEKVVKMVGAVVRFFVVGLLLSCFASYMEANFFN